MTDSANFSQLWPGELIEQAKDIIMDRFDLDAAQALGVLRTMSLNTRIQMCAVAEAIINQKVPDEVFKAAADPGDETAD
jgi:AmiR/NasT family two-component response regulator